MTSTRATVLLTSAGSGVGRCVLQTLAGRRADLHVVGGDSDPDSSIFADCDDAVVLPATDDPSFAGAVAATCVRFDVDLVIPARDPDAVILAHAAESTEWPAQLASPAAALVAMTRDKWATYEWCRERGIPFAESVATGRPDSIEAAIALVERWGFPLISKPRSGSASLGVSVITTQPQLAAAAALPGMMLQPFLSPPEPARLELDTSAGVPLFWEVPCPDEPAIMGLIGPDGDIGPHLCFTATHRLGRNEELRQLPDPGLEAFATWVLGRFRDEGWRGPLNLQLRRGPDSWHIIEINPRFTGGTSGRLHLGLDEVRWIVNRWLDAELVPPWPHPPVARVQRHLTDVPDRLVDLRDHGRKSADVVTVRVGVGR